MKRKMIIFAVLLILTVLLCGCDLWMDGSYVSVQPHQEVNNLPEQDAIVVEAYSQLRDTMVSLVENGARDAVISSDSLEQSVLKEYMDMVVTYITDYNAIGAYAVDNINYEIGTNSGKSAVAVNISYTRSLAEIKKILRVETMDEAKAEILKSLKNCDADVVVLVAEYSNVDLVQLVQNYANEYPDYIMENPYVKANVYPDQGLQRVLELSFTYQTDREALRMMQENLDPVFTSAELYVSGDMDDQEKYSQLFSFLMLLIERYDDKIETSITPTYSLLRHGVGDSRAYANVYAAMCRRANLDCRVVAGTRTGKAWNWNVIHRDGTDYYIDLLNSKESGTFRLQTKQEMQGYVWDYSVFS